MKPIFSIITPTYNQGKFISKTIESILGQAGDFFIDYIIMDGASTDQTVGIIQKYEAEVLAGDMVAEEAGLKFYKPKSRFNKNLGISFRYESKKDKGQSDAINQGFAKAVGQYTTWLNSDDYYIGQVISSMLRVFQSTGADVVVGDTVGYDGDGKEIWRASHNIPSIYSMLYEQIAPQQPAIFYTKELIDRVGGVNENLHYVMDIDLWLKFLFAGAKFAKLHQFVAAQVYHDAAKSTQGEYWLQVFEPEDKAMKKEYRKRLGWRQYYYPLKLIKERVFRRLYDLGGKFLPRPIKDILNRIIGWKRKIS
ncbi:MAG: glycosyltransferase [Candidatus Doudnabacteria bacterium]|nr:glycosyltransferase [Candidatus Doudnabacteria bacterium]